MTDVYFLDVNVLMYAAGKDHPYKQPCVRILASVESGQLAVAVDAEIFQELLYRYSSIGLAEKGSMLATALLSLSPTVLPLGDAEIRRCLELYEKLHSHGLHPRDALHAAAMLSHGITHIISTDRHFDVVDGITRIDPAEL